MNNIQPHPSVNKDNDSDEELPLVDPPYLAPLNEIQQSKTYCLILDLDETLVHFFETNDEGHVLVRPGVEAFLKELGKYYEITIFTAAVQDYADRVIDEIDLDKNVKNRLYRQHAIPYENTYIKDLSRLGRDLSKVIIVDNTQECFQLQPENGICIRSWFGDNNDTALEELAPILKEIVIKEVKDIREALKIFNKKMLDQIAQGITNVKLTLD